MRARLPIAIAAMTILFAVVASGCGDEKPVSGDSEVTSATGSTGNVDGINGTTSADAKTAYDQCIALSKDVPDSAQRAEALQRCKDGYEDLKETQKQAQQQLEQAKSDCKAEANKLPDGAGKTSALAACDKLQ